MNDETEPIPVVDPEPLARVEDAAATATRSRGSADDAGTATRLLPTAAETATFSPTITVNAETLVPADIANLPTDRYVPAVPVESAESAQPARPSRRARREQARTEAATRRRPLWIAGRIAAATTAVVVVLGTGFAYYTELSVNNGFTRSNAISEQDAAALDGDMNILLIGLDTRNDQDGNPLPKKKLALLHAGDGEEGGYNANSLILVHIPKDLKRITAFSIPRDDYVPVIGIPGYDHTRIKQAYGLKKAAAEDTLAAQGVKDPVELERQGREAGRESIIQNVKALTGVPINRFAEVSLVGFYDLADTLGGVDVCLNHAVDDSYYSGAVFPAGRQHLNAAQALSFVRQRHQLDNGDLDRTHRQQAFLTSVAKELKVSGTLTDVGKLQSLITDAQNDIVLSQGWNVLDFAQTLGRAGSVPIQFQTLPVKSYGVRDGGDVNIVDTALIRRTVRQAFGMQPGTAAGTPRTTPTSVVDVVNAGAAGGVAGKVSTALAAKGFTKGKVGNAAYNDGSSSVVYYGTGADTDADQAADLLGGLPTASSEDVADGHVKIVVGSDFTMPRTLGSSQDSSTSTSTETSTPATASAIAATTDPPPDSGKPVTTSIGSDIPCVN